MSDDRRAAEDTSASARAFRELGPVRLITAAAAAVTILAAFLPWASVLGISVAGIRRRPVHARSRVLGLLLALFGQLPGRVFGVVQALAGGLVFGVGIADQNEFAAIGLYLTLLAGAVWSVVGLAAASDRVRLGPAFPRAGV